MAMPSTVPTRPGAGEETSVTLPVVMKLYAGDAPRRCPACRVCRPHYDRCTPAPRRGLRSDAGTDRWRGGAGAHLRPAPAQCQCGVRGEDIAAGAPIASAGTVLTPAHIGVLAGQGIPDAEVFRPLTVGVLATGSELLEAGEAWAPARSTMPTESRMPPACGSWALPWSAPTARMTRRRSPPG